MSLQASRRGRKHRCSACGAAFYDLERELSACPKCETPYEAVAHMPRGEPARKRRPSRAAPPPETAAVPEAPAAEAREDDDGMPILDAADDGDEAEATDDADEVAATDDAGEEN